MVLCTCDLALIFAQKAKVKQQTSTKSIQPVVSELQLDVEQLFCSAWLGYLATSQAVGLGPAGDGQRVWVYGIEHAVNQRPE